MSVTFGLVVPSNQYLQEFQSLISGFKLRLVPLNAIYIVDPGSLSWINRINMVWCHTIGKIIVDMPYSFTYPRGVNPGS